MRMAMSLSVILLAMHLTIIKADSDLTVPHDISATWKRPVTLPCSYSPVKYTRNTVTWLFMGSRILESDSTGDHQFLTKYRGRLSIPKDREGGDVSLTIEELQIDDRGTYTCKVSLTRIGTSDKASKEAAIELTVKKVPVTKPVIQPKGSFLQVSERATVNLTCFAEGSLPISYRWYKRIPDRSDKLLSAQGATLVFQSAQTSDSGAYFCEAENTISEKKVQQSEVLQLTVTGDTAGPATTQKLRTSSTEQVSTTEPAATTRGTRAPSSTKDDAVKQTHHSTRIPDITLDSTEAPGNKGRSHATKQSSTTERKTPEFTKERHTTSGVSLYLIILVVILSLALLCTLITVIVTRSKRKTTYRMHEIPPSTRNRLDPGGEPEIEIENY